MFRTLFISWRYKHLSTETQCLSRQHGSTSLHVSATYWRAVAWFWNTHAETCQTSSSWTRIRFMGSLLPQTLLDLCWPRSTWGCSNPCSLQCIIHPWPWLVEKGASSCQTPWTFPTHGPWSGHWCICLSLYWTTFEDSGPEPNAVDFPPHTLDPSFFWVARRSISCFPEQFLLLADACICNINLFLPRQICIALVQSYFTDNSVGLFQRMPLEGVSVWDGATPSPREREREWIGWGDGDGELR